MRRTLRARNDPKTFFYTGMLTVMTSSLHTIKWKLNACSTPQSELVEYALPYIFPIHCLSKLRCIYVSVRKYAEIAYLVTSHVRPLSIASKIPKTFWGSIPQAPLLIGVVYARTMNLTTPNLTATALSSKHTTYFVRWQRVSRRGTTFIGGPAYLFRLFCFLIKLRCRFGSVF